jgi:hypothetical protein
LRDKEVVDAWQRAKKTASLNRKKWCKKPLLFDFLCV